MTLRYVFQPDCYRPDPGSACVQSQTHMELGPQIAVWLQDANGGFGYVSAQDGTRKDGTLMVTNAVARRGIGNRPGRWDFLSGPLFPYGKRVMALPIWAHARGVTYPTVNMAEAECAVGGPGESCLGWHESWSSPEPYYCRPLQPADLTSALGVDAISCPTKFNSEKGKLDATAPTYYPPRTDLTSFSGADTADPPTYATLNDLDAVAGATPPYGRPVDRDHHAAGGRAAGRLQADGRGEQGVRRQRGQHAPGLRRPAPRERTAPRGTSVSRPSSTRCRCTST